MPQLYLAGDHGVLQEADNLLLARVNTELHAIASTAGSAIWSICIIFEDNRLKARSMTLLQISSTPWEFSTLGE
jgi:hypothetical protein